MTTKHPPNGQARSAQRPITGDCVDCILRTCRNKSARGR